MTQVIFERKRTVAEDAKEGVSTTPVTGLSDANVFGKISNEICVGAIDDELTFCLPANEAVCQDDLALRHRMIASGRLQADNLFAVHLNPDAPDKMLAKITVERCLKLLFTDRQDVIEDILPRVAVEN